MYFYLILSLIFSVGISEIFCDCEVRIGGYQRPEIWKQFGSKMLRLKSVSNTFTLKKGHSLAAVCSNGFERLNPSVNTESKKLDIECKDYLYLNSQYRGTTSVTVTCRPYTTSSTFKLYETKGAFSWCDSKYMSYIIAKESLNTINHLDHIAAICYDLENMKLISIFYSLTSVYNRNLYPKILKQYELGKVFADTKDVFLDKVLSSNLYDTEELQNWYGLANYQYSSIIQNQYLLKNGFNEFGSMFDIIWWPNLRFGNWKSYLTELNKQNERETFNIIAGVSEIAEVPIAGDCNKNLTMVQMKDNIFSDDIPLYVWNYVESVLNATNKFVVIGVNSPFSEYYKKSDLIFCQDICNDIEWLKNVRNSFKYSTLGIVFCCSVDEVKKSKQLIGFPSIISVAKPTQAPLTLPSFPSLGAGDYLIDE